MTSSSTADTATGWTPPTSLREHIARGRAARDRVPLRSLACLTTERRDPMAILDAQDAVRVPELVPIRTQRMAASPFAFYRGTAALMAADLGRSPQSDLGVGSCGDAHMANFGLYASPQRTLVFDLNDFDEAAWASWEWDVKRLVTSILIAGRSGSRDDDALERVALHAVRTYARALADGAERSPFDRFFDRFDATDFVVSAPKPRKALQKAIDRAERHTGAQAARRLTRFDEHGRLRFIETPPTMTTASRAVTDRVGDVFADYVRSAHVDVRVLLRKYVIADVARRVVGVGSVGTRCYLIGLQDGDGHALLLQSKEAGTSVLVEHGKALQPEAVDQYVDRFGDGGRVVAMQRVLQAVSDPLLGHVRGTTPEGDSVRSFYVRQFHDKKGAIDTATLEDDAFGWYADMCAATLARAHAQSPSASQVVGYVGRGRAAGEAILAWCDAYAELSRRDWQLFCTRRGATAAESG